MMDGLRFAGAVHEIEVVAVGLPASVDTVKFQPPYAGVSTVMYTESTELGSVKLNEAEPGLPGHVYAT